MGYDMVGPVGGYQQVPLSSATQPAASEQNQVRQREQEPEEKQVQRKESSAASGPQKAESSEKPSGEREVRSAEKRDQPQRSENSSEQKRGNTLDITV
jgi:hypothetical protein